MRKRKKRERKKVAGFLTSSWTVAGPLERSRRVPLPVPSWTPDDDLDPPDLWLIMSGSPFQHRLLKRKSGRINITFDDDSTKEPDFIDPLQLCLRVTSQQIAVVLLC